MKGFHKSRTAHALSASERIQRLEAIVARQHQELRRLDHALSFAMGIIQVTAVTGSPLALKPQTVKMTLRAAYAQTLQKNLQHTQDPNQPDPHADAPTAPILGQAPVPGPPGAQGGT